MPARPKLAQHPLAMLLPRLPDHEYQTLKGDIAANGLLHPIILFEGKVLDGRHRLRACRELRIRPKFERYKGKDPRALVVSMNIMRRHLSTSQRSMVLAHLEARRPGARSKDSNGATLPQMAKLGHVSHNSLKAARAVRAHGTPKLQKAAIEDRIAVHVAAKAAGLPARTQDRIAAADNPATELRRAQRAVMERKLGRDEIAMPVGKFGVVYCDAPWRFEPYDHDTGGARAADNHYPTMQLDRIKAMTIPAADDAALFLWATTPMLPQALEVMAAWGFGYRSHIVWAKPRAGTGYWARSKHELLLIGTRGDIPAPAPGDQPESIIEAPLGRHSEKPAVFAELIERLYPTLPKIELFARRARPGWTVWGKECPPCA